MIAGNSRAPRQPALFTPYEMGGESPKVIPFAGPPAAKREPAPKVPRRQRITEAEQPSLSFSRPISSRRHAPPADPTIFCDARVASPAHRSLAAAIDLTMVAVSMAILLSIFYIIGARVESPKLASILAGAGAALVALFYYAFWAIVGTETIGMRWTGLRILTFDGCTPVRPQRLARLASGLLGLIAGGLGILWILVDEEQLAWHDHISKTFPSPDIPGR